MLTPEIVFDDAKNFGVLQTEIFYNFGLSENINTNSTGPYWFYNNDDDEKSFKDNISIKVPTSPKTERKNFETMKKFGRSIGKKHKKKKHIKHKIKKCLYKLFKGKRKKFFKSKKLLISLFMGIVLMKMLFVALVLKIVALLAAKGLAMGLFSTIMASLLSLKGMYGHSYGHRNRKDDGKTRVEIVHIPGKHDNVYYERPFKRNFAVRPINKNV